VIANPRATNARRSALDAARRLLAQRFDLEWRETTQPGHGRELAARAGGEGFALVAALGGDGTVNEVVNGLLAAGEGPVPALVLLPAGQADVLARIVGVPRGPVRAANHLIAHCRRRRELPLGAVGNRLFTFAAGIGLDAAVAARVDANPAAKARFGPFYYAFAALGEARRYRRRPPTVEVRWEGGSAVGLSAAFQCAPAYTYFKGLAISVNGTPPGLIAGGALQAAGPRAAAAIGWRAVGRRRPLAGGWPVAPLPPSPTFTVAVLEGRPLPVQVDGDAIGTFAEATFTAADRRLVLAG